MSVINFKVNIAPVEAFSLVRENQNADLVHEEFHDVGNGKSIGTLIFEKYYFRSKNRAALIVITDNIKGYTDVRAIATGSSEGLLLKIDWGAADDFAQSVKDILENYIID